MTGAPRMNDQPGAWQMLHQEASPAGMIQVHMGENDVVDALRFQPQLWQRCKESRHGIVGSRIHECRTSIRDDEMTGIEALAHETRVDNADAMFELLYRTGWKIHRDLRTRIRCILLRPAFVSRARIWPVLS